MQQAVQLFEFAELAIAPHKSKARMARKSLHTRQDQPRSPGPDQARADSLMTLSYDGREMELPAALETALEGLLRCLPELISNGELQAKPELVQIMLAADDLSSRISLEAISLIKCGGWPVKRGGKVST